MEALCMQRTPLGSRFCGNDEMGCVNPAKTSPEGEVSRTAKRGSSVLNSAHRS